MDAGLRPERAHLLLLLALGLPEHGIRQQEVIDALKPAPTCDLSNPSQGQIASGCAREQQGH